MSIISTKPVLENSYEICQRKDCKMKCRCNEIDCLKGVEAQHYAKKHLQQVRIDSINWETEYVCLDTGKHWLEDYPHSEYHGGGPPRLRSLPLKEE